MKNSLFGFFILLVIVGCEPDDPFSFYGGQDLLNQLDEAWNDFDNGEYDLALIKFNNAKSEAFLEDSTAFLIDATLAEIYIGVGWCHIKRIDEAITDPMVYADSARVNFLRSQSYNRYSFATSFGLMKAYYWLKGTDINTVMVDSAISVGNWILNAAIPSGMEAEFEIDRFGDLVYSNPNINANDTRFWLAMSYYHKGELASALQLIISLDSGYGYLLENDPSTWRLKNASNQQFDTFEETIWFVLWELDPGSIS